MHRLNAFRVQLANFKRKRTLAAVIVVRLAPIVLWVQKLVQIASPVDMQLKVLPIVLSAVPARGHTLNLIRVHTAW